MLKNNYYSFVVLLLLVFPCNVLISQEAIYSEVKVSLNNPTTLQSLAVEGFDIDHYQGNIEEGIRFFVNQDELQRLQSLSYNFEITIPNYQNYYQQLQAQDKIANPNPTKTSSFTANGFELGSMGGFYTLSEVVTVLDEMRADFPSLISEKTSIGTTLEDRPIWMVKISDNPDVDEAEPAAHFDALHHAREPLAMAATINYMYYLLENYGTDPYVTYLVDNREIYFVPVVNPDGYFYNETTNPSGGGLWRKNRNPNDGNCFGVDLNRNYGFGYAVDNNCSSPNPCSNVYRGAEAFSELESQAIRDLLDQTEATMAFSTHSTAGTYLMPYGFDTSPPAFDIYSEWASAFLAENDYSYGVTFQMLGYTSCGTTRDYLHSEGIYGWTPEIDGNGFWPAPSTIFDLVAENVRPFLYQSYIAGAYLDIQSHTLIGDVLPGNDFELAVEVKNVGVGATANDVSVIVSVTNPNVTAPTAAGFGAIEAREIASNLNEPFIFSVSPDMEDGFFEITATVFLDGVANESIIIPVFLGEKEVLFVDDAEDNASQWTATGNSALSWGINLDDSYSGTQSFGDSNDGNGQNDTETFFELNQVFDFTDIPNPRVQFASKYSLPGNDFVRFEASTNGGATWETLRNFTQSEDWNIVALNLAAYSGIDAVSFRFRLVNDGFIPGDGFYFDDFEVSAFTSDILGNSEIAAETITVTPNPFSDSIQIRLPENYSDVKVTLVNMLGQTILTSEENQNNNIIITEVDNVSSGLYFIVVEENTLGLKIVKRIIKK